MELGGDEFGESSSGSGLTLNGEDFIKMTAFGTFCNPAQQCRLIGVSGVTTNGFHPTMNRDLFFKNTDFFFPVKNFPPQCPFGLKPDKEQSGIRIGKITTFVMKNPTAGRHPRTGNDNFRTDNGIYIL